LFPAFNIELGISTSVAFTNATPKASELAFVVKLAAREVNVAYSGLSVKILKYNLQKVCSY